MKGETMRLILAGLLCFAATAAAEAQAPPAAVDSQAVTEKAVQALEGKTAELRQPFSAPKPFVCNWAGDRQRARCGVRVTEANLPNAEDYLQVYIAVDSNEFERNKTAIDNTSRKSAGLASRTEDPLTLTLINRGKMQLPTFCEQGIGAPGAYAFCAIAIGKHIVVESQMSSSGSDSNSGSHDVSADIDRARNLVMIGLDYTMRTMAGSLAPGQTP